jgi:hypothetical protein
LTECRAGRALKGAAILTMAKKISSVVGESRQNLLLCGINISFITFSQIQVELIQLQKQ